MSMTTQLNVLDLLYDQYRLYTAELGRTHDSLAKQYRKLEKVEKKLDELAGQASTRTQRRKLTWTGSLTKQTINNLTGRQMELYGLLQQCRDLIASYNTSAQATPFTPWTTYYPVTPFDGVLFDASLTTPWTTGPYRPHPLENATQYWDLSMLGENADSLVSSDISLLSLEDSVDAQQTVEGDADSYNAPAEQCRPIPANTCAVGHDQEDAPARRTARASSTISIDIERANRFHRRLCSEQVTSSASASQESIKRCEPDVKSAARLNITRAQTAPEVPMRSDIVEQDKDGRAVELQAV